jgi:hypothetical protein
MTGYKSLAGSLGQILQRDRAAEHNSVYGGAQGTNGKIRHAEKVFDSSVMTIDDRWALRDEIQELKKRQPR